MVKKIVLLVILWCVTLVHVSAQTQDEKAVAKAVEAFRIALIDPDSNTLKQLVSAHLSYGHSSGVVQDREAFIAALVSGRSDFVSIDISDQTITAVDDVAIVRHILSATTNDGGKPGTTKLAILLVWKKEHNRWVLLARQAVRT